ncbi:MAG: extracellular matrix regulator RemB [Candidatus Avigastranaerophilus sp.]
MYLHLGQETVVMQEDIVGIFDLDNTTVSKPTRDYLAKAEKDKRVFNVSFELPKTFVLTNNKKEGSRVYISQISSSTLLKRLGNIDYK